MARDFVPTLAPTDDQGRPLAGFGPAHVIAWKYVRQSVERALALPEDDRRAYWRKRRAFVARRLHEVGLTEDEVSACLRAFNERARREADMRRVLMRVEAETAAEGGDP